MKLLRGRRGWVLGAFLGYVLLALGFSAVYGASASRTPASVRNIGITAFSSATYSSPIAMSADNSRIWVVNPDDDSVSVIDPATDSVANKFNVGDEPQSVALDANGIAYVANAAGNDVTVIDPASGVIATLVTGAEPWNIVTSPNGARVFVANSAQDTITVINTQVNPPAIIGSVDIANSACNDPDRSRHFQPRGMAVTANNSQLYVSRFLSFVKAGGVQATDTGKEGVVCRFTVNTAGTTAATVLTAPTAIALASDRKSVV